MRTTHIYTISTHGPRGCCGPPFIVYLRLPATRRLDLKIQSLAVAFMFNWNFYVPQLPSRSS